MSVFTYVYACKTNKSISKILFNNIYIHALLIFQLFNLPFLNLIIESEFNSYN